MKDFLVYLFWPNPGNAHYSSPKAIALLVICAALVIGSVVISRWRKGQSDMLRRFTSSWPAASFWFGFTGLILIVSRVEQIQYVAMRFLWVVWLAILGLFVFSQVKKLRTRYYEVLPSSGELDPRAKYLPKRKRR